MQLDTNYKKKRYKAFARTINCAIVAIILQIVRRLFPQAVYLIIPESILMTVTVCFGCVYLWLVLFGKRE